MVEEESLVFSFGVWLGKCLVVFSFGYRLFLVFVIFFVWSVRGGWIFRYFRLVLVVLEREE